MHLSTQATHISAVWEKELPPTFSVSFYLIPQYKTRETPIISRELAYNSEIDDVLHRPEY